MTDAEPTAMFDLDETGELTPPLFEAHALTPYGRHDGLGPGIFGAPFCGDAHYGSVESTGRRVWIWHACSRTREHDTHRCDRCEEIW